MRTFKIVSFNSSHKHKYKFTAKSILSAKRISRSWMQSWMQSCSYELRVYRNDGTTEIIAFCPSRHKPWVNY